jgi:protein-L-isoaspartate(D-aspartate) O-methyltransferase
MAYDDGPLPIGHGQTISQPYIVALMTDLAALHGGERVLEVGTGSGYQAAILSCMAGEVHSVERIPELARRAARVLRRLQCGNVYVHEDDGTLGWAQHAPFAAILVTAASPRVPQPLLEQLEENGRLVLPLQEGDGYQMLTRVRMQHGEVRRDAIASVAFVPLVGRFGWS